MSVSIGPSGKNDEYLLKLDEFMSDPKVSGSNEDVNDKIGDTDTGSLARMARALQNQNLYFLFGSGSNQYNQLLLQSEQNSACLVNEEDAHEMKEIVLCTPAGVGGRVVKIAAGGGHSALLCDSGELFLWGWNAHGQLGVPVSDSPIDNEAPLPIKRNLQSVSIENLALGFSHTVVIEKTTGRLLAFGDNARGQVSGSPTKPSAIDKPVVPAGMEDQTFVDVAAGLFHSAGVTTEGDLITFGCSRYGQTLESSWRPEDGSRVVKVACGRRHTVALDEHGRLWTMGENARGQLGHSPDTKKSGPKAVEGLLGTKGSGCVHVDCGWSHTIATVHAQGTTSVFGWGRNDKGQLGLGSTAEVKSPTQIFKEHKHIHAVSCGPESTVLVEVDGTIFGCGWNEHGNLGTGNDSDTLTLLPATGAPIVAPPSTGGSPKVMVAVGGGHMLAIKA